MLNERRAIKFFKFSVVPISLYLFCSIWKCLTENLEINKQKPTCGIYGCIDDYLDFEAFDNVK